MTESASGWLFTGLHWESAEPVLTAGPLMAGYGGPPGREKRRPAVPGQQLDWTFTSSRRCVGVWTGAERRPCPLAAPLPLAGADSQCTACAGTDRGRLMARDAITGDDGRDYQLYLAWFGPELLKIGLTAADRGRGRLLEQGAIAFTLLVEGPYAPVRQAERAVAAGQLARERIGARAKAAAWWSLPGADDRAVLLLEARQQVMRQTAWPGQVRRLPAAVTDQGADFGIASPFPSAYAEVTAIGDRARLAGEIRSVIGRRLLLAGDAGLVLADMRLAAGRTFLPGSQAAARPGALQVTPRVRPWDLDARQQQLF